MMRVCLLPLVVVLLAESACVGDGGTMLASAIDEQLERQLTAEGIAPAPLIDDDAFLRRVMLDLAGRIPTTAERRAFLESDGPGKREQLVDGLLTSPDFAFHLRNELDLLLLAPLATDRDWRSYLLEAARENRSWDRIIREILIPEHERPDDPGARAFLRHRARDLDLMTNDVSALLLGVNIACAKCHDHPLVPDWQQDHYFGMASFFNRTYLTRTGFLGERFEGQLEFTTTSGEDRHARLMFLTGATVEEPEPGLDAAALKKIAEDIKQAQRQDDAPRPPLPEFSPRAELVRQALATGSPNYVARNMVNRIWARLMGRGLVQPLDQMHSENPPSHPELLDLLANDFVAHGYDLRRLIRGIVLSDAYARSSRWPGGGDPPAADLFAVGRVRPLTLLQFALSLYVASHDPRQLLGREAPSEWPQRREQLEEQANRLAEHFAVPDESFQVGLAEALFLSNGEQFENDLLSEGDHRLITYLVELDDEQLIDAAFESVLSRRPNDVERGAMLLYLTERRDRRIEAVQQMVWALMASPEFRFNH